MVDLRNLFRFVSPTQANYNLGLNEEKLLDVKHSGIDQTESISLLEANKSKL